MCGVIARSGPEPFRRVSRSVRIGGHATSIRLEAAFWDVLAAMAARQGMTVPELLGALHEDAVVKRSQRHARYSVLAKGCLWLRRSGGAIRLLALDPRRG